MRAHRTTIRLSRRSNIAASGINRIQIQSRKRWCIVELESLCVSRSASVVEGTGGMCKRASAKDWMRRLGAALMMAVLAAGAPARAAVRETPPVQLVETFHSGLIAAIQ